MSNSMRNWGQSQKTSKTPRGGSKSRGDTLAAGFRSTAWRFRCFLTLTPILLAPLGVHGQTQRPVSLNFENARVTDVIRSVAAMLGLNVVFTDVPDKRISFSTSAPVRQDEVGGVLESILESNNLVLVQKGAVAQVVPTDKAPATGSVRVGADIPDPPPLGLITQ